jgi:hypothetical protein
MAKSLQALSAPRLAKSTAFPQAGRQDEPLMETAKKGSIAKAIVHLFGPRGGKSLRYDKNLATRLLSQGKLTAHEHKVWKASGRVPDHLDVQAS